MRQAIMGQDLEVEIEAQGIIVPNGCKLNKQQIRKIVKGSQEELQLGILGLNPAFHVSHDSKLGRSLDALQHFSYVHPGTKENLRQSTVLKALFNQIHPEQMTGNRPQKWSDIGLRDSLAAILKSNLPTPQETFRRYIEPCLPKRQESLELLVS